MRKHTSRGEYKEVEDVESNVDRMGAVRHSTKNFPSSILQKKEVQ